jgi:hypothetical protein
MRRYLGLLLVLSTIPLVKADTQDTIVFRGRMLPSNEVPALNIEGAFADYVATIRATRDGRGNVTAATVTFEADYTMPVATTFTGFHIHNGPAGTNAGVVLDSGVTGTNNIVGGTSGRIVRVFDVPANRLQFAQGVFNSPELYYINLHSTTFPGGIVRDQLKPSSVSFRPAMLPANEVPAITSVDAQGAALIKVDVVRDLTGKITSASVTFDVDYRFPGAVTITGLHIHNAAAGVNGPIVIDSGISSTNTITSSTGRGNIFRVADVTTSAGLDTVTALLATPGNYYVNLHTTDNPGGVMRGQLEKDVLNFLSRMEAAQENPPTNTTGFANSLSTIKVTRDAAGNVNGGTVDFNVAFNFPGPITFTGLHIHNGKIGVNGPVLLNSNIGSGAASVVSDTGVGTITRQAVITSATTNAIEALNGLFVDPESYYINIHDTINPGGIVRAQLVRETYHFRPIMSGANEIPANASGATGTAWVTVWVNRDLNNVITGGNVTFDVNYNLGGPATITGLHIHRGSATVNGGVVIDSGLSGTASVSTTTGVGNITRTADILSTNSTGMDALNDLVKNPNGFYVNLHTTTFPGGIMRSQLLPLVNYLSQVAGGGDWQTSIRIINPSSAASVHGEIVTTDSAGNLITDVIDPTLSFWIPPSGNYVANTTTRGNLATGYARVLSSAPVTVDGGFVMPGLAGDARASSALGNTISIPVSVGAGGVRNTGVALLSLESARSTLLLTLRDSSGAVIPGGTGSVTLEANGKISSYVTQLLPLVTSPSFTGTLTIEMTRGPFATGMMAVTALQFDAGTVTPVTVTTIQ